MTTFAMIVLTVFTVLGSMILGWIARWYWSGSDGEVLTATSDLRTTAKSSERGAGAIGTVAAGTASMHHITRDEDDAPATGQSDDSKTAEPGGDAIDDVLVTHDPQSNGGKTNSAPLTKSSDGSNGSAKEGSSHLDAQPESSADGQRAAWFDGAGNSDMTDPAKTNQ